MASSTPLHGTELIDCARANGREGLEAAAYQCGYGDDLATFEAELRKACDEIGVDVNSFNELTKTSQVQAQILGEIVAPDSATQL
jgi:hypothetical protein